MERICFRPGRFDFEMLFDTETSGAFVVNENLWRVLVVVEVAVGFGTSSFSASST